MRKRATAEALCALAPDHSVLADIGGGRRIRVRPPNMRAFMALVRRHPSAGGILGSCIAPEGPTLAAAYGFLRLCIPGGPLGLALAVRRMSDVQAVAIACVQAMLPDISALTVEVKDKRPRKKGKGDNLVQVEVNSRDDLLVHLCLLATTHGWDLTPTQLLAIDALDMDRRRVSASLGMGGL